jgi:hypothetical protein
MSDIFLEDLIAANTRIEKLEARIADIQEQRLECFKSWRNIETLCTVCSGAGVRAYSSTTGWHGGIGGQMMISGVCDHCWGSGDEHRHGADLRRIESELNHYKSLAAKLEAQTITSTPPPGGAL